MKVLNYQLISSYLSRLFVTKITITRYQFSEELKSLLNNAESKRLFDYYKDIEEVLVYDSKKNNSVYYKWKGIHQDHFSVDAIRDIFLNYPIRSQFGRIKGVSPYKRENKEVSLSSIADLVALKEKLNNEVSIAAVAVSTDKKVEETITLDKFSNIELITELYKRGMIESISVKMK